MSELMNKIKQQQILAAEEAVIANLREKGLLPKEGNQTFFKMQHFPKQEPNETFSKTVLVFDEKDNSFCDLGYYDFEKGEWFILGGMSMKLICWCYIPNPTEFLKGKDFKSEKHYGYC